MSSRTLVLILALVLPTSICAQIPPRKTVASAAGVARIVVATPNFEAGVERSAALEVAQGFRDRVVSSLGSKYQMVSREVLNKVLTSSGYEADVPLSDAAVRALATQMQAALVFSGTLKQEADGRLTASATFAPPASDSPRRVSLTQDPGQNATAFGAALAEQLVADLR